MSKSKHFVTDDSSRSSESQAHKQRRAQHKRLQEVTRYDDIEALYEDDEEFETFERIKKEKGTRRF